MRVLKPSTDLQSCVWQSKTFGWVRSQVGANFGYPLDKGSVTKVWSYEEELKQLNLSYIRRMLGN